MGSVCCVADRDRVVTTTPNSEISHRNIRQSPSWSFRWDNRVRVVGDESSVNWNFNGAAGFNERVIKSRPASEAAHASEEGSPLDYSQSPATIQKSPVAELSTGSMGLPSSDSMIAGNSSQVKPLSGSPEVSFPSPVKLSPSMHSVSSLSTSPLSSQGHPVHPSLTPARWHRHSPRHQLFRQVSDSMIPGFKSPTLSISEEASSLTLPGWSYDSTRGSIGGSSDGWSIPTFPDIMTTSRRERWSFDSETLGFVRDRISRSSAQSSGYQFDLQSCGICARLLAEKSSWGAQKIMATNELSVVAVLICGHAYHAECLENMTSEINKYDPACPVCTFGEKQAFKMCEKALKAEIELRTKKRCRSKIIDGDFSGDLAQFDRQTSTEQDGRSQKLGASSSTKSSVGGRPFLKRHFSFGGSKGSKSIGNHSSWKRGFFWAKSSKK